MALRNSPLINLSVIIILLITMIAPQDQQIKLVNSFLGTLGYQEKEQIYLRLIPTIKDRKAQKRELTYPLKKLPTVTEPYNLFYVVNGQGQTAREVKYAKALFCEFDDISLDEQKNFWQKFNLPQPTLQLFTGGKSIHHYWVLNQPLEIVYWKPLISDLIDYINCDKANKDASRLLRLPAIPYCDKTTGKFNGKYSEIIINSGNKYGYVQLRNCIPFSPKETKKISQDNGITKESFSDLLNGIIEVIPTHKSGNKTYQDYRAFLCAIKNEFSPDLAISIAQKITDDEYNWEQIINSSKGSFGIGTIIWFGKQYNFDFKQFNTKIKPKKNKPKPVSDKQSDNTNDNEYKVCVDIIKKNYGDKLTYNELTSEVELDSQEIADKLENIYLDLACEHNFKIAKNVAYDAVIYIAKKSSYHPIKNYLESLTEPNNKIDITSLSSKCFGTTEPIYDKIVYCFLIASVARIYQAGCKVDNVLVLNGKQGIYKSAFFSTLFSPKWFTDNLRDLNKDDLLTLHKHWCIEIDELDKITSKKQAGELKAFITKQRDDFRKPYGKTIVSYKRQSVLVGTCNKEEFLVDETGNRRFWVIKVNSNKIDLIDIDWVKTNRDAIWYQAKKDYEAGVKWWLSSSEEIIINESNKQYEHSDVWLDIIEPKLNSYEAITIEKLMRLELNLTEKDMTRANQMRVANILKQLGYEKKRKMVNGSRDYVWVKPVSMPKNVFEIGEKVEFQVGDLWHIGYIKTINDDLTFDCYWENKSGFVANRKPSQIKKIVL